MASSARSDADAPRKPFHLLISIFLPFETFSTSRLSPPNKLGSRKRGNVRSTRIRTWNNPPWVNYRDGKRHFCIEVRASMNRAIRTTLAFWKNLKCILRMPHATDTSEMHPFRDQIISPSKTEPVLGNFFCASRLNDGAIALEWTIHSLREAMRDSAYITRTGHALHEQVSSMWGPDAMPPHSYIRFEGEFRNPTVVERAIEFPERTDITKIERTADGFVCTFRCGCAARTVSPSDLDFPTVQEYLDDLPHAADYILEHENVETYIPHE